MSVKRLLCIPLADHALAIFLYFFGFKKIREPKRNNTGEFFPAWQKHPLQDFFKRHFLFFCFFLSREKKFRCFSPLSDNGKKKLPVVPLSFNVFTLCHLCVINKWNKNKKLHPLSLSLLVLSFFFPLNPLRNTTVSFLQP